MINMIEILQEDAVIKIDADKLGRFYILGGAYPRGEQLLPWFESIIAGEPNPEYHKHYMIVWKRIKNYYLIYYSTVNERKDLFASAKAEFVKFSDITHYRLGLAFSERYQRHHFQSDNTRYYKLCITYEELWKNCIECLRTDHSITLIDSVASFDAYVGKYKFYRGHSKYIYDLVPGIFRGNFSTYEKAIYNEYLDAFPDEEEMSSYKILSKMQHYGLPTRLLDITTDRYVALFMACSTVFGEERDANDIGEVLLFNPKETVETNSKVVKHLSELAIKESDCNCNETTDSYFINYDDNEQNIRKRKQKGTFIIFGSDNNATIKYDSAFIVDKRRIINELSDMGYNEKTLVPEREHVCHHIKQKYTK